MPNGDGVGAPQRPAEGTVPERPTERTAPEPPTEETARERSTAQPRPGAGLWDRALLGRSEQQVAIALIAVFMLFVVLLVLLRSDEHWDRLVFLLGGVEALVFAAAGALFGTSVQRTQATEARQLAAQERQAAADERERADRFEQQARNGQALADVIRAKAEQPAARASLDGDEADEPVAMRGARPDRHSLRAGAAPPGEAGGDRDLAELALMVDRWFPPGGGTSSGTTR